MKIGILHIVKAHLGTLRNERSGTLSKVDLFIFFIFPILIGTASHWLTLQTGREFYNVSITFFGIFIGLLLNIQVAIFSILQRKWTRTNDEIINKGIEEKSEERRKLLGELNINVSYLIIISCISCVIYIILFGFD